MCLSFTDVVVEVCGLRTVASCWLQIQYLPAGIRCLLFKVSPTVQMCAVMVLV